MKNNKKWLIIGGAIVVASAIVLTTYFIVRKRNGRVRIKNKNPKRILIVGDSQSAIETDDGKKIKYTYPNILQEKLSDKGVDIDVVASIGKTTSWMKNSLLNRLKSNKYDRVYIYGGGNDSANSSIKQSTTLQNIQDMVNASRSTGADVFVNLGYKVIGDFANYNLMPLSSNMTSKKEWIPYIERKRSLQKAIPKTIKNANFIQPYDLRNLTSDGIHTNSEGHKIVAKVFYDTIV